MTTPTKTIRLTRLDISNPIPDDLLICDSNQDMLMNGPAPNLSILEFLRTEKIELGANGRRSHRFSTFGRNVTFFHENGVSHQEVPMTSIRKNITAFVIDTVYGGDREFEVRGTVKRNPTTRGIFENGEGYRLLVAQQDLPHYDEFFALVRDVDIGVVKGRAAKGNPHITFTLRNDDGLLPYLFWHHAI